ncbi:MAG: DUF899 domain-containing protein [Actinophytocola sp.]|uniref:DUF899 domain-containing protein n=1 Tax=Actinophytocola sp. TaxID=1872138 RepID=UPI0013275129|nr:DUF899 domain-containing protein [Actinophytocola sp.]MPZ81289.1 DUF899 domain-containing protein [Actinophytocola sp.]
MSPTKMVSRAEWVAAREELYAKEVELLAARDAVSAQRRELPWVEVDKEYVFETPDGKAGLLDLFDGRRQLIVYHFMVPRETGEFCTSCSFWIDNIGHLAHFHARDTTLVIDCPVPLEMIQAFKERMGWTIPWVSSKETSFYDDFYVKLGDADPIQPGISVFARDGDRVFHTYSTLQFGGELLNGTYHYLDLTPLGRQEDGLGFKHEWVRYHDEYDA